AEGGPPPGLPPAHCPCPLSPLSIGLQSRNRTSSTSLPLCVTWSPSSGTSAVSLKPPWASISSLPLVTPSFSISLQILEGGYLAEPMLYALLVPSAYTNSAVW